ncbi:hypothetical protein D3C85_1647240 [compost metagenome]
MRDDDACQPSAPKTVVYHFLRCRIKRARRLVQHDNRWIAGKSAGNLQTLTLTAAEIAAILRDDMLIAAAALRNMIVDGCILGRSYDVNLWNC